MGTPQSESSWAGWAISSFTNKIGTTNGEIEAKPINGLARAIQEPRSSSVPPTSSTEAMKANMASASELHRKALKPVAPIHVRKPSEQFFEDAQTVNDEVDDAWGEMGEESFFDAPVTPAFQTPAFDDGGEPDFAGWLSAQAQAKVKSPLPKGLSKPMPAANGPAMLVRTTTTGSVGAGAGTKKLATTIPKPNIVNPKMIDTKPKTSATTDDDWGDAWD